MNLKVKKNEYISKVFVMTVVLIAFAILFFIANPADNTRSSSLEYSPARIISVVADHTFFTDPDDPQFYGEPSNMRLGTVIYEVEVLRGSFAGLVLEANYYIDSPANVFFEVGDQIVVRIFEFDGELSIIEVRHPDRMALIFVVVGVFLIFLSIIGGKRGVFSVISLIFSVACVMFLLIPFVIQGYPVILMTLMVLVLIVIATGTLLAGITEKGISAILGCLGGAILSAIFATIVGSTLHVSGYNMTNAGAIMNLSDADVSGLFVSSVLVASIGAVMDATMSVASAMNELKIANPQMGTKDLFKSGFSVGRDVMGTMSSTLILAFIGGSLTMIIFMQVTNTSFYQFINHDFIVMEIVKGVAGSFGIILATPLTALISAKLLTRERKMEKN